MPLILHSYSSDSPISVQITANCYPAGVGLAPHIDTHYAFTGERHGDVVISACKNMPLFNHTSSPSTRPRPGPIVSLSLGSHCSMVLRKMHGDAIQSSKLLLLPRRSLLIMSGESRYAWQHGIAAAKSDLLADGRVLERSQRVSITFRKVGS